MQPDLSDEWWTVRHVITYLESVRDRARRIPSREETMGLRAVVVYRKTNLLPRAYHWCKTMHWQVAAVVPSAEFAQAMRLITDGMADIIVAASRDSLDPDRLPRVEIVPDQDGDNTGSSE